jgi:hypothetical protein
LLIHAYLTLPFFSWQIPNAEFTFPPWTSFPAKRLLTRILDPNPMTVCQSTKAT